MPVTMRFDVLLSLADGRMICPQEDLFDAIRAWAGEDIGGMAFAVMTVGQSLGEHLRRRYPWSCTERMKAAITAGIEEARLTGDWEGQIQKYCRAGCPGIYIYVARSGEAGFDGVDPWMPPPEATPKTADTPTLMYLSEVIERVKEIASRAGDPESAPWAEDSLHQDVLRAIAEGRCGGDPPEKFAAEALKTLDLKFPRWFA